MNNIELNLLKEVADMRMGKPLMGAFNIRRNGEGIERKSTEDVAIIPKTDKPGIDIIVKPGSKPEDVHIPVIVTESGVKDKVYNDFIIGEGAEVTIVAGCGIHNCGSHDSQHDGVHKFILKKGAKLKYTEKHYGEGTEGAGKRILNPVTIVEMEEDSYCEMETVQIKGVDSTKRDLDATLGKNAKIVILERLLTHDDQFAESNMEVVLKGEGSSAQVISRTVGQDNSVQVFNPRVIGEEQCTAHVQCDSILMGDAKIRSIPEIAAEHPDAMLVHEAAIGKIAGDQILKLMTLGLTAEEAEQQILNCFLK